MPQVSGNAGGHATVLVWQNRGKALGCVVLAAAFTVWGALHILHQFVVGVAAILIGAGSFLGYKPFLVSAGKANVGAVSEKRVAAALLSTDTYQVMHSRMIGGGGDADHLAIGPWAVALETKTGRGRVSIERDGTVTAGSRQIMGDPLEQLDRQSRAFEKLTGIAPESVLCIPGMSNAPFVTRGGVHVCSAADLPGVIGAFPVRMSEREAKKIAKSVNKKHEECLATKKRAQKSGKPYDKSKYAKKK